MRKIPVITAILFSTLFVSCGNKDSQNVITSGRIDYQITYLNDDIDKKTRNILPSKMKLSFNEKEATNNIEGFMGMYKLNAFTNFHTRKCSTILKVFDQHYLFRGNRDEQMCCFDTMDDMEIIETGETKKIAGFECHKAIVKLPSNNETFEIYYTDEISLRHPNATNPYSKVKGVLMEFQLKLMHLNMRFTAESYRDLDASSLVPSANQNSKLVSRSQMTQILDKLLQ
jgi:GLPGLI family protein